MGPVLGPHARTDRTWDTRVAESRLPAPEGGRLGEGQRLTPDALHNGGKPPPLGAAPHHPGGTQLPQGIQTEGTVPGPHTRTPAPTACGWRTLTARPEGERPGEGQRLTPDAPRNGGGPPPGPAPRGAHSPKPGRGEPGPKRPPPQARQTEQGTEAGHAEEHRPRGTALPAPSAGTARGAHATPPKGGGERTPRERERTHTQRARGDYQKGNRTELTERTDRVKYRTRHTQLGTRGAGRGKQERHNTRYRPEPPEPAASAAHTRTGHCTRQGSSGALRHAPTPRLGSLRAIPRGSHWRQASSTGPAAPAPQATTH